MPKRLESSSGTVDINEKCLEDSDSDYILNGILNSNGYIHAKQRLQTSSSGTVKILRRNLKKTITHFTIPSIIRLLRLAKSILMTQQG